MADFTITEDFPENEIEFDKRFSDPKACYDYLFTQKWPDSFIFKKMRPLQILGEFKKSVYPAPSVSINIL